MPQGMRDYSEPGSAATGSYHLQFDLAPNGSAAAWKSAGPQRGPLGEGRDGAVAVAALIAARRADGIPVAVACRTLGVSRFWFYKHKDRRRPPRAQRRERLKAEVACCFALHEGKYGSPRITADLWDAGWRVSENTVEGVTTWSNRSACQLGGTSA